MNLKIFKFNFLIYIFILINFFLDYIKLIFYNKSKVIKAPIKYKETFIIFPDKTSEAHDSAL